VHAKPTAASGGLLLRLESSLDPVSNWDDLTGQHCLTMSGHGWLLWVPQRKPNCWFPVIVHPRKTNPIRKKQLAYTFQFQQTQFAKLWATYETFQRLRPHFYHDRPRCDTADIAWRGRLRTDTTKVATKPIWKLTLTVGLRVSDANDCHPRIATMTDPSPTLRHSPTLADYRIKVATTNRKIDFRYYWYASPWNFHWRSIHS